MRPAHAYVHVPFCARRCVYCDFSIAVRNVVPVDEYLSALTREWDVRGIAAGPLETLYFGGGTPSKLGADGVARMVDLVASRSSLANNAEVTLEANPEDVSPQSARAWAAAGINRVSLGVQSFDERVLLWMHRTHTAEQAGKAIQVLREASLANISIDLIFAMPAAVGRGWERDLDAALELNVPHVSIYGLTVEPHTPLGRWVARADAAEAPEESFEREFLDAHARLCAQGFDHYEVSNYGQPGFHSRHNWAYWRRAAYVGLGPSAHGFDGRARRWNVSAYAHWTESLAGNQDPVAGAEELGDEEILSEEVYLGLRTEAGVGIGDGERDFGERLVNAGWATLIDRDRLRLTARGWLRLDTIAADLTALRSHY